MSLCFGNTHRWDAQVALAKGGVEDGDLCACGAVRFGAHSALEKGIREALADGGVFAVDLVAAVVSLVRDRAIISRDLLALESRCAAAEQERARLREENTRLEQLNDDLSAQQLVDDMLTMSRTLAETRWALAAAEQRGRALESALRKYADPANYDGSPSAIDMDDGEVARTALSLSLSGPPAGTSHCGETA